MPRTLQSHRAVRVLLTLATAVAGILLTSAGGRLVSSDIASDPLGGSFDDGAASPARVSFTRDIRPLLSNRCYQCHGPDGGHRMAGLRLDLRDQATRTLKSGNRAIVPGDPKRSALIARITHADAAERMPPSGPGRQPLSADERALFERWIREGADYETHWAFVPPTRPQVPVVADRTWIRNPIDAFVRAEQERRGYLPAPEAPPQALLRRATFGLNGLPPTPDQVASYLSGSKPNRFEQYVDQLFESTRYGEHMARYWLDAARYGDTHGLHLDNERSMWPYREWVIDAFNANQPYDRFVVDQIAGDLLPKPTLAQRIATGFNRCNVTSAEGGMIAAEYLALYAMDRVDTTSTVFLGLTIGCAKCHDHKFDPITQREYYELFAFFNSINEEASDRNALIAAPAVTAPTPDQKAKLADLDRRIKEAEARLGEPDPSVDADQAAWEAATRGAVSRGWVTLRPTGAYSAAGTTMTIESGRTIRATGKSPDRDVYEVVGKTQLRAIRGLRLELLPDPDQPGGGIGRASHNNIVLTHVDVTAAPLENPERTIKVAVAGVSADWSQREFPVENAIDGKAATGWAISGGTEEDRAAVFRFAEPISFVGGTQLRVKLGFGSEYLQHTIARFRISVTDRDEKTPSKVGAWHRCQEPFPADSAKAAFATVFEPENNADLDARYQDGKFGWVPAPEFVDGKAHFFSQLPRRAYYVQRIITAPAKRQFTFFVGSDDAIKVIVNGKAVLERDVRRGVAADQDRVVVDLQRGENRILLKVVNDGGACGYYFRTEGENIDGVPALIARILRDPAERTAADVEYVRRYYRRHHSESWRRHEAELRELVAEKAKIEAAFPRTMVMEEGKQPREAFLLIRGQYDQPGDRVLPEVPAVFPRLQKDDVRSRLTLARWLIDPKHPLTARVYVNRLWQMVFGTGLVATPGDFGSQGTYPTHKALLDWLAVEFVESGWDVRHMLRLMMTSSTYRQSARVTVDGRARDPGNAWLARGPRHRLDAEQIRDAALYMSGLLVEKVGGPSVRPYQPTGIWKAVGYTSSNTANFRQGSGEELWRRSLYTFWKRTAPPPTMALFDAPSRESCSVRRGRTNTPLQALALLNDIQFVEAARAFGARALKEGGRTDADRLRWMWCWTTSRDPTDQEIQITKDLLMWERAHYAKRKDEAEKLINVGDSKPPAGVAPDELAAWTSVANMLLNLDETLNQG